jgi:alkanesulfonate monooxygenase SsuD/methylene tetrahydromethanopterin reductase-like flavin-dependent oxidoreductase (luciferase family)
MAIVGMTEHRGGSRRALQVGLFLPVGETMLHGDTAGWADLLALARQAEDAGFDSLWVAITC